MKKIKTVLGIFLLLTIFISCGNDGIYKEDTNREAVKKRKERKDSIEKAESFKLDSLHLKKVSPVLR